ncbi:hypothetical protein BEWA_003160 [Theileria equi strain WA]|uniref:Uncharacterized protein n=1 Tax=Theileria equi strain WA TaxID=1537102 RepID=L0B0A3_THEEQ|nr:hypothetical protein BEWA_003160 [Theileria equi strain WA]AFZ80908.1 hypothetical protein BEWA_003160 [Theileria equi strain WA]|eukprot:XP_004830574.1 hypothetical protein BEWA_003160 [Theileria equi strain WA]
MNWFGAGAKVNNYVPSLGNPSVKYNDIDYNFDNNPEADYLLANMTPFKHYNNQLYSNNYNGSTCDTWTRQNPLYMLSGDDLIYTARGSDHELLMRYLNDGSLDSSRQSFDESALNYLFIDQLVDSNLSYSMENIHLDEYSADFYQYPYIPDQEPGRVQKSNSSYSNKLQENKSERYEPQYILEGTGTILKIVEALELWLRNTSAENNNFRMKKQFTKNDNFVVVIKKQ